MPHNVQIPDEMWDYACEQGALTGEGPASFIRAVMIGHMRRNGGSRPRDREATAEPRVAYTGGSAVHKACYEAMVDEHQGERPHATPWEATRSTLCPRCGKFVEPGDQIVMTKFGDWE